MDGPYPFTSRGLQAFQRVDTFVYADRRLRLKSSQILAIRYHFLSLRALSDFPFYLLFSPFHLSAEGASHLLVYIDTLVPLGQIYLECFC